LSISATLFRLFKFLNAFRLQRRFFNSKIEKNTNILHLFKLFILEFKAIALIEIAMSTKEAIYHKELNLHNFTID
jgi:hypothetical protein